MRLQRADIDHGFPIGSDRTKKLAKLSNSIRENPEIASRYIEFLLETGESWRRVGTITGVEVWMNVEEGLSEIIGRIKRKELVGVYWEILVLYFNMCRTDCKFISANGCGARVVSCNGP